MHKIQAYLFFALILLFTSCGEVQNGYSIKSPDTKLEVKIENDNGKIHYTLSTVDKTLVGTSEISIFLDKKAKIVSTQERSEDSTWEPTWGQFSKIRDHYNELTLEIEYNEGSKAELIVRAFNHGIGFRHELETFGENDNAQLYIEYNLQQSDQIHSPSGESSPIGPISIESLLTTEKSPKLKIPVVVQTEGQFLSILESDLFAAPGCKVMNIGFDKEKQHLVSNNKIDLTEGKYTTPWRVILVNDQLGDLVTNSVPLNLATPLKIDDPSWIKPGKTLWDWRVHGYTAPDGFTYGINTESYKRFIDFADEMNIEYFLIDDAWYKSVSKGSFEMSDELDLEEVIGYANEKNVELLLYYDRKHGEYGDEALFPYYAKLGMKGIKYGFMGSNVNFTREAIQQSAASQLLIDFHDGPVPFTGIERTFPNAITKEYCHAQQDSRRAFTPETFIKMALINAIQGPLDMNNGNFDLTGINNGERQKGPKVQHSYISTVVSEAARTLIIHSGLVCIPDAPEAYLEKADLFEFIQRQPVGQWDESKVLHAKMGEYISTARMKGDQWFVGSVYNQEGGTLDIVLDFLEEDVHYEITYYEDTEETHGKTNPEAYRIRTGKIRKDDVIEAKMASGGGHCMWIRPISK